MAAWLPQTILARIYPKGGNVDRAEVRRRRERNKASRAANRPSQAARAKAKRVARKKRARARR